MKIKDHSRKWNLRLGSVVVVAGIAAILLAFLGGNGQSQPALTASLLGINQIRLTISNAVPGQAYELQRQQLLGTPPWLPYLVGTNSQTNFVAEMGIDESGFFRLLECTDCDMDGVPNWADPQPNNSAISNLVVTIDIPANGSNIP